MRSLIYKLTAVGGLLLIAGCGGPVLNGYVNHSGVPTTFTYAAANRDMTVVVVGNPFSAPKAAVDLAVTDAMQGRHHGPRTHFTTTPSDNARRNYRIVMMFDPPRSLRSDALCGDVGSLKPDAAGARIRMLTVFCARKRNLVEMYSSIPAVDAPRAPVFAGMVGAVMWGLIPLEDPFTSNDEDGIIVIIP